MEISLPGAATRKQDKLYCIRSSTKFNRSKPGDSKRSRKALKLKKKNK